MPVKAQHTFPPAPLCRAGTPCRAPGVRSVLGFPFAIPALQRGFLPNEISDTKRRFFCCI